VSVPAGKCAHKPGQTHRSSPRLLQLILKDHKSRASLNRVSATAEERNGLFHRLPAGFAIAAINSSMAPREALSFALLLASRRTGSAKRP
jgi:hypothetical protein